ncbi:hypothetical protein FOA52_008838 [Chlamydomonas sp. UWO 241]|nr:hypothetical protein FOA52_008838 [Chlamydomonas sp. UWO 241]
MAPLKGKKAWRKNIDASEVEEARTAASHQERHGPSVASLKDSDLFFVDTAAGAGASAGAGTGKKPRSKMLQLRSTAILAQAHKARPVTATVHKPRKVNGVLVKSVGGRRVPRFAPVPEGELDLWGAAPVPCPGAAHSASIASLAPPPRAIKPKPYLARQVRVGAVEVSLAGCSYNPEPEAHQDALAALVSSELKRQLRRELAPAAPPKMVAADDDVGDALTQLQVEEEADDEDENEIQLSDDDGSDGGGAPGSRKRGIKKTAADRNRERRRASADAELAERKSLKRQRRDLDNLALIEVAMAEELSTKDAKRQRRHLVRDEKAATLPQRLGRHKFEPAHVQVATTDELGGSLRTVKPDAMQARDRFKSLQHRGLIEPRKPLQQRTGRKVYYESGARMDKALAMQAELDGLKAARRTAGKARKKVSALSAAGGDM